MKKIKENTIKRYTLFQLMNHIEFYQRSMEVKPFRIDRAYGKVYKYDIDAYFFHSLVSRDNILRIIDELYRLN